MSNQGQAGVVRGCPHIQIEGDKFHRLYLRRLGSYSSSSFSVLISEKSENGAQKTFSLLWSQY